MKNKPTLLLAVTALFAFGAGSALKSIHIIVDTGGGGDVAFHVNDLGVKTPVVLNDVFDDIPVALLLSPSLPVPPEQSAPQTLESRKGGPGGAYLQTCRIERVVKWPIERSMFSVNPYTNTASYSSWRMSNRHSVYSRQRETRPA